MRSRRGCGSHARGLQHCRLVAVAVVAVAVAVVVGAASARSSTPGGGGGGGHLVGINGVGGGVCGVAVECHRLVFYGWTY